MKTLQQYKYQFFYYFIDDYVLSYINDLIINVNYNKKISNIQFTFIMHKYNYIKNEINFIQ